MKAFTIAIFLCVVCINVCSLAAQTKTNGPFPSAAQIGKLGSIGEEISAALLRRDTSVILKYDRPDLRDEDSRLLSDNKSDLHCYLFETDCIQWHARSVYDQIRDMGRPEIAVKRWGKSADGDPTYLLVFYDKAKINGDGKLSVNFICDHSGNGVVTWTFAYVKGQWVAEHPPFDAEVDSVCQEQPSAGGGNLRAPELQEYINSQVINLKVNFTQRPRDILLFKDGSREAVAEQIPPLPQGGIVGMTIRSGAMNDYGLD